MFTMDAALHGCQRSLQAITAGELGKGLELLLAVAPVLLVQIIPQECRCLPADAAVLPGAGILHQSTERRAVVVAVRALWPEAPLM